MGPVINTVQVSIPPEQIAKIEALLGGGRFGNARKAMQAAISDTITTGRALIARRVKEEVQLNIADIKNQLIVSRGSYDVLQGSIQFKKQGTWLIRYMTAKQRQTKLKAVAGGLFKEVRKKGGITVKVRNRATPKYPLVEKFPHAFLAVMPHSLHLGIFERTGVKREMKSGRYKGKVREVIHRMRGPSALGVFLNARGQEGASTVIQEVLEKMSVALKRNIQSQIDRFTKGASAIART